MAIIRALSHSFCFFSCGTQRTFPSLVSLFRAHWIWRCLGSQGFICVCLPCTVLVFVCVNCVFFPSTETLFNAVTSISMHIFLFHLQINIYIYIYKYVKSWEMIHKNVFILSYFGRMSWSTILLTSINGPFPLFHWVWICGQVPGAQNHDSVQQLIPCLLPAIIPLIPTSFPHLFLLRNSSVVNIMILVLLHSSLWMRWVVAWDWKG